MRSEATQKDGGATPGLAGIRVGQMRTIKSFCWPSSHFRIKAGFGNDRGPTSRKVNR
jgi:hypothetical protein